MPWCRAVSALRKQYLPRYKVDTPTLRCLCWVPTRGLYGHRRTGTFFFFFFKLHFSVSPFYNPSILASAFLIWCNEQIQASLQAKNLSQLLISVNSSFVSVYSSWSSSEACVRWPTWDTEHVTRVQNWQQFKVLTMVRSACHHLGFKQKPWRRRPKFQEMPSSLPALLTFLVKSFFVHYALLGLLVKLQDADFLTHNIILTMDI